jgi:hypothetical protein
LGEGSTEELTKITNTRVLTDAQVLALCSELNHILWTEDTPVLGSEISRPFSQHEKFVHQPKGNMQCGAHTVVCAGLMLRQGESVTTRSGSALVVYPEQQKQEKPLFIAKHWWMTISSGLFDLSLNLSGISNHKPIIFRNANLADPHWKVVFKDDFAHILDDALKYHAVRTCGVFYQTDNKIVVTKEILEPDLLKEFTPARNKGLPLKYLDIVRHCERLLQGGKCLLQLPQEAAWQTLLN